MISRSFVAGGVDARKENHNKKSTVTKTTGRRETAHNEERDDARRDLVGSSSSKMNARTEGTSDACEHKDRPANLREQVGRHQSR